MALPVNPEAFEDTITDNRQRLQKSLRAGQLNIVKSVQTLTELTLRNFFASSAINENQTDRVVSQIEKLQTSFSEFPESIKTISSQTNKIFERAFSNFINDIKEPLEETVAIAKDQLASDEEEKRNKARKERGGILGFLKQVLGVGAAIGLITLAIDNWESIVAGFEAIKPYLISFGEGVYEVGSVILPFIVDNWKEIIIGMLAIKATILAIQGTKAVVNAVKVFNTWRIATVTDFKESSKSLKERAGNMMKSVRSFTAGVMMQAKLLADSAVELGKSAKNKIVEYAKKVRVALLAVQSTVLTPMLAAITPVLVAAAPVVAIAAGIALVFVSLNEALKSAKEKFEETGSVWLAIEEGISEFIGMIIGFPIKLLADGAAWVARQLGFEEFAQSLTDFDPVAGIKETFRTMMRFIYDPETGKILGLDFDNILPDFSEIGDQIMNALPEIKIDTEKLQQMLPEISFDADKFKQYIRNLLPEVDSFMSKLVPDSVYEWAGINPETGEMITQAKPTASGGLTGTEVDVRSEAVATNNNTVAPIITNAPTNVQNNNMVSNKPVTVVAASPYKSNPYRPDNKGDLYPRYMTY